MTKTLQKFTSVAPGSIMLMGEHAVLHGYPALAAAIDKKMHVTLTPHEKETIEIRSTLGNYKKNLNENIILEAPFEFLLAAIKTYENRLPSGFILEVNSEFSDTQGLGSSAAVTVATLSALSQWLESDAITQKTLLEKSIDVIRTVQGMGSGADACASIYGGVVYYKNNPLHVETFKNAPDISLIYSGKKETTKKVVARVEEYRKKDPEKYNAIFNAMSGCCEAAKTEIEHKNWKAFGTLISQHHTLMDELGVNTPALQNIVDSLERQDTIYGAKISGSGLGDCVVGIGKSAPDEMKIQVEISKDGVSFNNLDCFGRKRPRNDGTTQYLMGSEYLMGSDPEISHIGVRPRDFSQQGQTPTHPSVIARPKAEAIQYVKNRLPKQPWTVKNQAAAFAPSNIALCKYWGKRNNTLNLPVTSSLSISLGNKGSSCAIQENQLQHDCIRFNGETFHNSAFCTKIKTFLDLFRPTPTIHYDITITMNIPVAAGLASSACGFAALVKALNALYNWQLDDKMLSQLARLGSGSASRSLWDGFVMWHAGEEKNGEDCFAEKINTTWPELCIGVVMINKNKKQLSSREAMNITTDTSPLYKKWPEQVSNDLNTIQHAIEKKDFNLLGKTSEENAIAMHDTMAHATPKIIYSENETQHAKEKVHALRDQGIDVYFTQDAGPNLKLLFKKESLEKIQKEFPNALIVNPFPEKNNIEQVILVDENDNALGQNEKLAAHEHAQLHRAFSVFIFRNDKKEVLLQQRHLEKYHCGGLWTNTCCSHPRPGESTLNAAKRRLNEEMGLTPPLIEIGHFIYKAEFDNGLTEHELDHVLIGDWSGETITPNPKEVQDFAWVTMDALREDLEKAPERYTPWFSQALELALKTTFSK